MRNQNMEPGIEEAHDNNDALVRSPQEQVFTNNLIVDEIARYIHSVVDLRAFRLTNGFCYDACISNWRKKVFACLDSKGVVTIQNFLENVYKKESVEDYHVCQYSLPPVPLSDEDEVQRNVECRFWKECGPHMKHLSVIRCEIEQSTLLNLICNMTRKLESLTIETCYPPRTEENLEKQRHFEHMKMMNRLYNHMPEFRPRQATSVSTPNPVVSAETWDTKHLTPNLNLKVLRVSEPLWFQSWKLLEYFPNLEELKVSSVTDENLFSTLHHLRRVSNFSIFNLRVLNMIHAEQSWDGLAEANFPMEHLRLFLGYTVNRTKLQKVLTSQSATLKTLTLHQCPKPWWIPLVSFPSQLNLSILEELHFWGKVVENFNFLRWTPSLKILVMDFMCLNMLMESHSSCPTSLNKPNATVSNDMIHESNVLHEAENFQHLNLEHFQIDFHFGPRSLKFLGKWMPNLKVLKTILNDTTLALVCKQWTKLETLRLLFESKITDEGVTGLACDSTGEVETRECNITNLSELTDFCVDCYSSESQLTDASVHNGFLQMPQLKTLTIYCSSTMSENAEALLKKKIPNAKVFRNHVRRQPTTIVSDPDTESDDKTAGVNFYFDPNHLRMIGSSASE